MKKFRCKSCIRLMFCLCEVWIDCNVCACLCVLFIISLKGNKRLSFNRAIENWTTLGSNIELKLDSRFESDPC